MLDTPDLKCDVCGMPLQPVGTAVASAGVSRSPDTRRVRGVICKPCGIALGFVEKHGWDVHRFAANVEEFIRAGDVPSER
jgi:hypothetical protein